MAKFSFFLPVKPYKLNQPFGVNGEYYSEFLDQFGNPERGHNGIDLGATHGQPVYAPCDGHAQFLRDAHGGEGFWLYSDRAFDYKGTQAYFTVILWHLIGDTDPAYPSPVPTNGSWYPVRAGDLIGYADNTGAPYESSGDHDHVGLMPTNAKREALEARNGFNGCIDPLPFWNGYYAEDAQKVITIIRRLIGAIGTLIPILKKEVDIKSHNP